MKLPNKHERHGQPILIITGASGFVGKNLLPLLVDSYCITALSRHEKQRHIHKDGLTWKQFDLLKDNSERLFDDIEKPDILVHLAWELPHEDYWTNELNDQWLSKSMDLVKAFLNAGGKHVHIAGTCAEYDWTSSMPLTEASSKIKPKGKYGKCKNALRVYTSNLCKKFGATLGWYRIFWLYGKGQDKRKFIPSIINQLASGKKSYCLAANLKRDYIHVQDAANVIHAGIMTNYDGTINIGSGKAFHLGTIASSIAKYMNRESLLTLSQSEISADNPEIVMASVSRCRKLLPITPLCQFENNLKSIISNVLENGTGRTECQ